MMEKTVFDLSGIARTGDEGATVEVVDHDGSIASGAVPLRFARESRGYQDLEGRIFQDIPLMEKLGDEEGLTGQFADDAEVLGVLGANTCIAFEDVGLSLFQIAFQAREEGIEGLLGDRTVHISPGHGILSGAIVNDGLILRGPARSRSREDG